jgi:threonine dehydratase
MQLPTLTELDAAAEIVRRVVPPTPQYCWPLLSRRVGAELWVKHENHTQTGAFKIRGAWSLSTICGARSRASPG